MDLRFKLIKNTNIIIAVAVLLVLILIPIVMVLFRSFLVEGEFHIAAPVQTIIQHDLTEVFVKDRKSVV